VSCRAAADSGALSTSGDTGLPALTQPHIDRDLAEYRHRGPGQPGQRGRHRLAATGSEHLNQFATVRAGQAGHVLDHAGDPLMGLHRDCACPLGHLGRGRLWGGDHDQLGAGQQLGH